MAGIPSRCAISCATSCVTAVLSGRSMRLRTAPISSPLITRTTGDCDKSMRKASVSERPSVGSVLRLVKSATRRRARSASLPDVTRVPKGPTPSARRVMKVPARSASAAKAMPPPHSARRQVKSFFIPVGVIVCMPVAWAIARFRSCTPVRRMIGSPASSSPSAPRKTQSGRPSACTRAYTMAATPTAARTNSPPTRAGLARRACAAKSTTGTGCVPVGVIPPLGVRSESKTGTSSSAVWKRSAGFFSRQRITAAARGGGTVARCSDTWSGTCVTCATSTDCGEAAVNGGWPVSIS